MPIFDSLINPIPPIRRGIQAASFQNENGENSYVLYDSEGYTEKQLILAVEAFPILQLFDGRNSVESIFKKLTKDSGVKIEQSLVLGFAQQLDECYFLVSENFKEFKDKTEQDFIESKVRTPVCAGNSYSEKREELTKFFKNLFKKNKTTTSKEKPLGIVVPHIDLRIGAEIYVPAYKELQNSDAETFVIFGTSHYGYGDLFVPTDKNFLTPFGTVETDSELVTLLQKNYPFPAHFKDLAHRQEHSIEFQVLFLQHIFKNRPFKILPILCTSFFGFIEKRVSPKNEEIFASFTKALSKVISETGRKVNYIVSADLAHVGKKFGDDFPAKEILKKLKDEDQSILDSAVSCKAEDFYQKISAVKDERRICGLPPIYSFLETAKPKSGKILAYDQWDEAERESAVTFASAVFY